MNPQPKNLELARRYIEGTATAEETRALEAALRTDAAFRRQFLRYANVDAALGSGRLAAAPVARPAQVPHRPAWFGWLSCRPLAAAAAGLVIGLFSATVVWAVTSPRVVATASRLFALVDGSFEKQSGRVAAGFPVEAGLWSGDEAEVVHSTGAQNKDGRQVLRFIRAGGEATTPNSPAEACDVYQIVDLRHLRAELKAADESLLELSAEFLDARTVAGAPVSFACHIYLFEGAGDSLHAAWPQAARDPLGVGAGHLRSTGGPDAGVWRRVTARCVLPAQADFAVIKLSAARGDRRRGPAPELGRQFVDDVRLTLKTQPELPVRIVQR